MKKQKLDFKAKKYISTYYIKNGKAVISIDIKDNNMFYNELDHDGLTLSNKIIHFIDNRIDYILYRYEVVLKFYCEEITEDEKKKITNMIRTHYGLEANERNNDLNLNKIKSSSLFLLGVVFLALSSISNGYSFIIKEILSIAGWVAIWEMVTSMLFGTIKIKLDKYDATKLSKAEIYFITGQSK